MRSSIPYVGSESPANGDDSEPNAVPMAPIDLARGYAALASEVNHTLQVRLSKFEADLDETRGIALAAHGVASETRARVEDIAVAVRAKPVARISVPPPTEKLEIKYTESPTGTHAIVDNKELERLQKKFAEKEAEERGAKEALQKKLDEEEIERKRAKEKREFWLFVAVILGTAGGFIAYLLGHFVFKG